MVFNIIDVPCSRLDKLGSDWLQTLKALKKEQVVHTYSLLDVGVVRIVFERDKAKHIQTVLEFYESKDVPRGHVGALPGSAITEEDKEKMKKRSQE